MSMNQKGVKLYFKHVEGDKYICQSERERKKNNGFTNLISYVITDHPKWKQEVESKEKYILIMPKVSMKAYEIFEWMDKDCIRSSSHLFCRTCYDKEEHQFISN